MLSTPDRILRRMRGRPTKVWTASKFVDIASRDAVDKALQRLEADGKIRRIDRGLYDIPRFNELTGKPTVPDTHEVVKAIAARDGARMLMDGLTAANGLGLTNAVQSHVIYYTDAKLAPLTLGNQKITFMTLAPSRLYWAGKPGEVIVQALEWAKDVLPTDGDRIMSRLKRVLSETKQAPAMRKSLAGGLGFLPLWMLPIVKDLLAATAPQPDQQAQDGPDGDDVPPGGMRP